MVTRDRILIAIGYKYNTLKVLYFIVTEKTGITHADLPYLSNYTDQFSNVSILPVACTLFISKLFGSVNAVDSHNKPRQSNLDLDKSWVTQCCCMMLFTTVAMGTNISNSWKLFHYGVKRE